MNDANYWSMVGAIGTWVAGFATLLAVCLSMYFSYDSKRLSIKKFIIFDDYSIQIRLFNRCHLNSEVEHIYIASRRNRFISRSKYKFSNADFIANLKLESLMAGNETPPDFHIQPHGKPFEINLSFFDMALSYNEFIPYEKDIMHSGHVLNRPTKMPDCGILIILTNGDRIIIPLPREFYKFYKIHVSNRFSNDFYNAIAPEQNLSYIIGRERYLEHVNNLKEASLNSYKSALLLYK
ncbi:hypothetical protein KW460_21025 [Vibrio fluvialis]|nr:hypothetical protein [Vibrio fluvialis]